MAISKSEHTLELVQDLLDDLELGRSSVEKIILKASRLARIVGAEEIKEWLRFELGGFYSDNTISLKYMTLTGRWTNRDENKGYWMPLAQIEARIEADKAKLSVMRTPDSSGDHNYAVHHATRAMNDTTNNISKFSGIRSKVIALLHKFITDVYYEKVFDNLSESIFESYKREVDHLISENCGDVLEQIPTVMERLSSGNVEAISHALTTCRRVIESFADSIFPASDETMNIGGNELKLDASKHQNRINAYIHQRCESKSRKQRFRQNLANLFDRVSTGVHRDVTSEEAKALFLNTYLFLGEVLHLEENKNV
ncbi:AbiTii domain-containing protein [Vibrio chagasii]|nr:AbiTii domain-containing protein [Vibrio chagasii]